MVEFISSMSIGMILTGVIMSIIFWNMARKAKQDLDNDDRQYFSVAVGMIIAGVLAYVLGGVIAIVALLIFMVWAASVLRQGLPNGLPNWRNALTWLIQPKKDTPPTKQ